MWKKKTTLENLRRAMECPCEFSAWTWFRSLEHAEDRGTTQSQWREIQQHYLDDLDAN